MRRGGGGGGFFFQAEDGIRDYKVTGVQTCALPILQSTFVVIQFWQPILGELINLIVDKIQLFATVDQIGRASCRERV